MAINVRPIEELIRIAGAGGGLTLLGTHRSTDELARIADASSSHGSRLILTGMATRPIDDLVKIASAGGGCVSFLD